MEIDSQVELYDSDLANIREVFHKLGNKYRFKADTKQNLLSLVHEAEDEFRTIGFEITVGMSKKIAWAMGAKPEDGMPNDITFIISERVGDAETEFDYEKMAWEAKKDLIPDGVARKFVSQGGTVADAVDVDATVEAPEKQAD